MQLMEKIETYTPDKTPIAGVVFSEPRIVFVPNGRGGRYRQVIADVVQQNPQNPADLYVQSNVLLNFATKREEMVDPTTGVSVQMSKLGARIPGLDVDIETGEVLTLQHYAERVRDGIMRLAGSQQSSPPEAAAETGVFEE